MNSSTITSIAPQPSLISLFQVLQEVGPEKMEVGSWPVIGQFSSIGSLGANPDQWLCDEWLSSLSQCQGMLGTPLHHSKLLLVSLQFSCLLLTLLPLMVMICHQTFKRSCCCFANGQH